MQVGREIAKPGGVLKVKMFARVALLRGGSTTAVRMPNTSLVLRGTENFVIVEREPGVLATRKVRVREHQRPNSSYTSSSANPLWILDL